MQRLSSDRGAVAVMTALLLVPLLVCAALVVDIGSDYVQRRQLQNAADAAALAVAQDCKVGNCSTTHNQTTADFFKTANIPNRTVTATVLSATASSVTVRTTEVVNYVFGPVIGVRNNTVAAQATASWTSPTGGQSVLPLAISLCSFNAQTGGGQPTGTTPVTIETSKNDNTKCTGPSGNVVPGGFGWLKIDDVPGCVVTTSITNVVYSKPGASRPCDDSYFTAQLQQTVLLPIFDVAGGNGTNAWYQIYGYAAFRFTGFHFQGSHLSIQGYFTVLLDQFPTFTYGAGGPSLGTQVVTLTA